MTDPLSQKQLEFIDNSTKHWNFAHGAVSTGKTICTAFRFMQAVNDCPDSEIAMIGKTSTTIFNNVINLIFESPELRIFRPFCVWSPSKWELKFKDKTITIYGAKDAGSYQLIQGRSLSLAYCDEMTLYHDSFIHMLDTRLRKPHSMGFGSMNPTYPSHIVKQWIDKADAGDPNYYHLHFKLEDNPFVDETYKARVKSSLSGVYFKRNYLGEWCLAEGAIFEFFDRNIHVYKKPPRRAEYWICGIDYGFTNAFAALIIGVSTGIQEQIGKCLWVEKEMYWDSKKEGKQLTHSEFAYKVKHFLEPYSVNAIYIDPSAAAMRHELRQFGIHTVQADNDVYNGIQYMTAEMNKGNLFVSNQCTNLIREIEGYVWDSKKSEKGEDEPVKKADHAIDALRYAVYTHKVQTYNPYKDKHNPDEWNRNKYDIGTRRY